MIELANSNLSLWLMKLVRIRRNDCHRKCWIVSEEDHGSQGDESYDSLCHCLILQTIYVHKCMKGHFKIELCNHSNDHIKSVTLLQFSEKIKSRTLY